VIVASHYRVPIYLRVANEPRRTLRGDYAGAAGKRHHVNRHLGALIEQVADVALEGQTHVFVRLADLYLVAERQVRLEVGVRASPADHAGLHEVPVWRTSKLHEIAAMLRPLARGGGADYR